MLDLLRAYMPHTHCWAGDTTWILATVMAHGLVASSYAAIATLVTLVARHLHGVARWLGALGAAFIAACGITHGLAIIDMYDGLYRLSTVSLVVTAFVSVVTACLGASLAIRLRGRLVAFRFWSDTVDAGLQTLPAMVGDVRAGQSLAGVAQALIDAQDGWVLVASIQTRGHNAGRIFAIGSGLARALGREPGEMVDSSLFDHVYPDDLEASAAAADREVLAGEAADAGYVNRWRCADGSPLRLRWLPLRHVEGDPVGAWIASPE